jgi:hypothetical protein
LWESSVSASVHFQRRLRLARSYPNRSPSTIVKYVKYVEFRITTPAICHTYAWSSTSSGMRDSSSSTIVHRVEIE